MSPLDHLASLLRPGTEEGARAMTVSSNIDAVLTRMQERTKGNGSRALSEDLQLKAVRRFWQSQEVASFRDAYLLSWGLCLPHRPSGSCVLEDRPRFQAVLDGVDGWSVRPSAFRRCYQGLVKSYFTYDALGESAPPAARNNWKMLRDYLRDKNGLIRDKQANPDWVATAIGNQQLFGERPCDPYVDGLLKGDVGAIDHLCEELGIAKASWFLRELVLAQIRGATQLGNAQFQALVPRLLELLANNDVLRDRGLIMLLDRYVKVPGAHLHQELRDSSVLWWGNPWLPSNETRWGGVVPDARTMVADWLKLEFIETFFTKLAEDGMGDRRRMEFWKRYVKAIDHIEFALGSTARNARDRDFIALRKKMTGLICRLEASGTNNAFIMTMGNLVAVEFSGLGNALYGYDARKSLPFDTSEDLRLAGDAENSLKQKAQSILWLSHQDGIHKWDKWEHMFEATLRREFDIEPGVVVPRGTRVPGSERAASPASQVLKARERDAAYSAAAELSQPYSRSALNKFASRQGLQVEDKTSQGGSLWVRTDATYEHIAKMLTRWGFQHKPGKGWWK
ncbi:EH signature domain-containing protein [Variovorax paradoxus]|uniref:EH signature domain-containing protein n=1 Tax=Variovorax paradoxus TaxID=34073 RepID=UPI0029C8033F|nr:EH signature domain-containing protein [Variovorax paradoxus]WPH19856.1 EH signature domain-containing protein [Variovorax paradoxus]